MVLLNIPFCRSLISKVNKMNPPTDPCYVPLISLLYPELLNYLLSSISDAFIKPTDQSFVQEAVSYWIQEHIHVNVSHTYIPIC